MSVKSLKKFTAVLLSALILIGCAPCVFAASGGAGDVSVYTDARDILATVISECSNVDEKDYAPGSYRLFTEAYENAVKLLNDENASDKELENAYMDLLGEKVRMVTVDHETGKRSRTDEWMAGYEFGAVLAELNSDDLTVQSLLSGFDISSVSIYPYDNPKNSILYVRFKEKTEDIVWKAVEVLKSSAYVSSAEPHYWNLFDYIPDDGPKYRLENEVKDYSLFKAEDYTEESYRAYTLAYEKAVRLLADVNATDEQFESAYSEILQAKFHLIKVTEPTETATREPATGPSKDELEEGYEFGAVLVGLYTGGPTVEGLLSDFELESVRFLAHGSSEHNIYYVKFTEKTKEIVWKAIEVLKESPYVKYAEPNYYNTLPVEPPFMTAREKLKRLVSGASSEIDESCNDEELYKAFITEYEKAEKLLGDENASDEQLEEMFDALLNARDNWISKKYGSSDETTESTFPTATEPKGPSKDELDEGYEFGAVLVGLYTGGPTVEGLLSDFELESVRFLAHGSSEHNIYYVKFTEKTKEIVWKAIEVLKESPYVKYAEPNYYNHFDVMPTDFETDISEPSEQTPQNKEPDISLEPTVTDPAEVQSGSSSETAPSSSGEACDDTVPPNTEKYPQLAVEPTDGKKPATDKNEPTDENAEATTPATLPDEENAEPTTDNIELMPSPRADISKFTVLGIKDKSYTGKAVIQKITVNDGETTLKLGRDYKVSYKGNKKVGTATVIITGKGGYSGTITKTFKVNPKGTALKKITPKKKAIVIKWKKNAKQTSGYEIEYSLKKSFKKADTIKVKNNKITSKKIKRLKSKKTYYVRIRAYQTVKGKKLYSDWSKAKTVDTK